MDTTLEQTRDKFAALAEQAQGMREDAHGEDAVQAGWSTSPPSPYLGEWDMDLAVGECPDRGPRRGDRLDAIFLTQMSRRRAGLREARYKRQHVGSFEDLERWRDSFTSRHARLREAWGAYSDPFAYGQGDGYGWGTGGVQGAYVPLLPGPVTRQLYWADYFAMSAKAFEAYNHDPVTWRCVHMKQEFALGKGLQGRVTVSTGTSAGQEHARAQAVWDEFWKRNKMDSRLDMLARDISVMGEQFLRYFRQPGGRLAVRSLDPASIFDLITDQEDIETVYGYHQQFQTPYQLYAPPGNPPLPPQVPPSGATDPGATSRYIIRQIPAADVDHYKLNSSAYERRGRSDLYPALSWVKRLRDYLTSHVIRADMISRISWDVEVDGNRGAVSAAQQSLFPGGQPPPPGTVFGHSNKVKLTPLVPEGASSSARFDPVLDSLVTMVANGIGLPKDWLGFGMQNTRAGALVATEPAARSLEELQGTVEQIIHAIFDRVMAAAGIGDADLEVTFPSIATEDRSAKLKDLAYAEGMGWLSKRTAASVAAKELGNNTYDFDEEQSSIAAEFPEAEEGPDGKPKRGDGTPRRSVILASQRQAAKLDITKSPATEDEPPGLLVPTDGSTPPSGQEAPPTRGGAPADENPLSGPGAKNIKQDNTANGSVREATFTAEQVGVVAHLVAEAARGRRRTRPDDPAFAQDAGRYRQASAENIAELVRVATGTRA